MFKRFLIILFFASILVSVFNQPTLKNRSVASTFSRSCHSELTTFARATDIDGNSVDYVPRSTAMSKEQDMLFVLGKIGADKFEVNSELGVGGQAATYLVKEKATGKSFAVKTPFEKGLGNLVNEQEILKSLNHKNIIKYIDSGEDYLIVEYVKGQSLREYIEKLMYMEADPKKYNDFIDKLLEVVDAVEYLQQKNLAHLDIKPDNIMLGENGEVKLIDFGASMKLEGDLSKKQIFVTKGFSSPWQMDASLGNANSELINNSNDIYSIKATFLYAFDNLFIDYLGESVDYQSVQAVELKVGRLRASLREQHQDVESLKNTLNDLRLSL